MTGKRGPPQGSSRSVLARWAWASVLHFRGHVLPDVILFGEFVTTLYSGGVVEFYSRQPGSGRAEAVQSTPWRRI